MVDMYFAVTDDKRFVYVDSMGEINGDNIKKHLTNLNDLNGEDSNILWEPSATRCINGTGLYGARVEPIGDTGYLGVINTWIEHQIPKIKIDVIVDTEYLSKLMEGPEKCQNSK